MHYCVNVNEIVIRNKVTNFSPSVSLNLETTSSLIVARNMLSLLIGKWKIYSRNLVRAHEEFD